MVTNISASSTANIYNVTNTINTNQLQSSSDNLEIEDYFDTVNEFADIENFSKLYSSNGKKEVLGAVRFEKKEDFLKFCDIDVSNLEQYTSYRMGLTDSTGLEASDYKAEFQDYMKSRGCESEEELKALVSTHFDTKATLMIAAKMTLEQDSMYFHEKGIIDSEFVGSAADELMSKVSLQDVAKFYNSRNNECSTFKESVSCFKSFIDKISEQDNVDDELKSKLLTMSQSISSSSDLISEVSEAVEKENEAERNLKKYNSSKIANYQTKALILTCRATDFPVHIFVV